MTDSAAIPINESANLDTSSAASKQQSSQAIVVQTYSNSVLEQSNVDFSGFSDLETYADEINGGLDRARDHAHHYLNDIQPLLITNVSNIESYYELRQAATSALDPSSSASDWLDVIAAIQEQTSDYQQAAKDTNKALTSLHDDLTQDSRAFSQFVSDMNSAVNGDHGALKDLEKQIDDVDSHIHEVIAGEALGGVAIAGGAFMCCVGGVAEFVTAGTSTALVLAGVAVMSTGFVGEAGGAAGLVALYDSKRELLQSKAHLQDEVKLALGLSSGYASLKTQASAAVDASTAMLNAWGLLSADLDAYSSVLKKEGASKTAVVAQLWATTAQKKIPIVLTDIGNIKAQLAGVKTVVAQPGQTIGQLVHAHASQG